jgi:hypothetical protein
MLGTDRFIELVIARADLRAERGWQSGTAPAAEGQSRRGNLLG